MQNKTTTRRKFLRGAVLQGAALSAIPLTALGHETVTRETLKGPSVARLPLRIMMKSGISDTFREKILKISPLIKLEESDQATGEVNAWFGRIHADQFKKAGNLAWVQSPSAGVESYMYPEFITSDVLLTNAKGCYAPAISEHAFGLLFSLTRRMSSQTRNMSSGQWKGEENMIEMKGLSIGIIGLGGIGSQIARRARAMDMQVIAVDIVPKYREQIGDICDEVRLVQDSGLKWLLPNADIVVSAVPHTKNSEGMLGAEQFAMMKNGAYFLNVSRGKIVRTPALVEALRTGHLSGAGLDVTDPEPLPPDHALWKFPNVIITSHIAARSQYSADRMQEVFAQNVYRFVNGLPLLNQVDKEMGF